MGQHSGVHLCLCHEIAGGLFPTSGLMFPKGANKRQPSSRRSQELWVPVLARPNEATFAGRSIGERETGEKSTQSQSNTAPVCIHLVISVPFRSRHHTCSCGQLFAATKTFLKKTKDNFQTKGIGKPTRGGASQGKCLLPSAQH